MYDLDNFRLGVASASLGMAPSHTMERKMAALQDAGFVFCEVGFGDYVTWVRTKHPDLPETTCPPEWCEAGEPDPSDEVLWHALYAAAPEFVKLAKSFGLRVLAIQPLNQFDGWPRGSKRAIWVKRKAERWLPLCALLEVELLQVGANDLAEADASDEETADDLRWLAELGAQQSPVVKIAYEAWCFSKRVNTWEHTWEIVKLGKHPNLGLCLDVAHFPLAPTYGWDPVTGKGWSDEDHQGVCERLRQVPADKIFYVEMSDVLEPNPPLGQGSDFDAWRDRNQPARGDNFAWVICARPVPFIGKDVGRSVKSELDMGGAKVVESLKAILHTGFKGPIMFEFFEAVTMEQGELDVPGLYAQACARSAKAIASALKQ